MKGPTGCGKSFLGDALISKFGHLIRIGDVDSLPSVSLISNLEDNYHTSSTQNNFKCSNSLFPSLQFSTVSSNDTASLPVLDQKKVLSRLTDAHFQVFGSDKDYHHVRKYVEMLKSHGGILLIELTEFDFEGSMHSYILKVLNETFSNSIRIVNINSCTPTLLKKAIEPLKHFQICFEDIVSNFNGDSRATLHDLLISNLVFKPNQSYMIFFAVFYLFFRSECFESIRDYRTDFFHYVGKLLYPSKTKTRIFDDISFWDLNFDLYVTFLQYYFPKFVNDLEVISKFNDVLCSFDSVSWKVLVSFN